MILKRFLRLEDEALIAQIYDYHGQAATADGRIDAALKSETIRDTRLAEGITREMEPAQVFDFSYIGGKPLIGFSPSRLRLRE